MRLLIFILAVLAVAVAVTQVAVHDPGYVLIARAPWTVETSLTFFAVLALIAFALLYFLVRITVRLWRMPTDMSQWRRSRQRMLARRSLTRGILHLIERDWAGAEQRLLEHLDASEDPLINYLGAALAAQYQGDLEKRDQYLADAHASAPRETLAIGLTQAELQHRSAQAERALATLTQLRTTAPRNMRVLKLLVEVYQGLRDWPGLAELLATVRKRKLFSDEEMDALELETYSALLNAASRAPLKRLWRENIPKHLRQKPALVAVYARRLLALEEMDECEGLLKDAIERRWDPQLAGLYGQVQSTDPAAQLKTAETWLKGHPLSPNLLLSAGRIAIRNKIWGAGRRYLETAIANGGPAEAYLELGELLEQLGEAEPARDQFRAGLTLAARGTQPARTERLNIRLPGRAADAE